MTPSANQIFRVFLISLFICAIPTLGQNAQKPTPSASTKDATWTRTFAVPFNPLKAANDDQGKENELNIDPRFRPLLKSSFPQRQWFWYEHGQLVSTADLIETFIGVPGDAILDEGRYVTADGCVPHDCDANRGMLWIDTGTQPATLIFVGINPVSGNSSQETSRLWIFSSRKLDWQKLPNSFTTSLTRWLSTIAKQDYRGTGGYHYKFALATIVQPNGVMEDITPETLSLGIAEIGNTKTGAIQ